MADAVGPALLVVLDTLAPAERLAFVLHDLFGVPFDEIGQILGRSTDATKMLASRARRKVRATERPAADGRQQREVVRAFLAAARRGDFAALLQVLDPDVRLTADTADGVFVTIGATEVAAGARFGASEGARGRGVLVDGRPGFLAWRADGSPLTLLAFTVVDGRIAAITAVSDPGRLASMDQPGQPTWK